MLVELEHSRAGWLEQFRFVPTGMDGEPRGRCEGCGGAIWSAGAYRIPSIPALHCSVLCIEAHLLGLSHCRWCGRQMEKPYTSIESRLCSEDCSANYWAHVEGDRSAKLGTGKRFLSWIQRKQPAAYRQVIGSLVGMPPQTPAEARRAIFEAYFARPQGNSGQPDEGHLGGY